MFWLVALFLSITSNSFATSPDAPYFVRDMSTPQDVSAINQNFRSQSDYLRQLNETVNDISDTDYAQLSASQTFTGANVFISTILANGMQIPYGVLQATICVNANKVNHASVVSYTVTDTPPVNTDGVMVATVTITPHSIDNHIIVRGEVSCGPDTNYYCVASIFQAATNIAVAANPCGSAGWWTTVNVGTVIHPTDLTPITLYLRATPVSGSTVLGINRAINNSVSMGNATSWLMAEEVIP